MDWLNNTNSSYMIITSDRINEVTSILYAKEYQLLNINEYFDGVFKEAVVAWGVDNDDLRRDLINISDYIDMDGYVKYLGESQTKRVNRDGSETPMELVMFNTDSNLKTFILNGISFSFKEGKRYWIPKTPNDLKVGMIVEYMNSGKWHEKTVKNPEDEWNKMYKLLIKYEKLRIPQ